MGGLSAPGQEDQPGLRQLKMNAPLQPSPDGTADAEQAPILGVYLSPVFPLKKIFGDLQDPRLVLLDPEEVEDPAAVECALCWAPADDAFAPYPNLKLAGSIAAGVDSILACPSLPADATVTRVRDDHQADQMAGFAAFHVVWHHRRMGDYIAQQAKGTWVRSHRPPAPARTTVGVLGFGLMGKAVARACAAMGFTVIASVRAPRETIPGVELVAGPDAVQQVAARADILVNVLPLTEATRDILNADLFARMPRGAALIQIGRGEHMIEEDLLAALDAGQLSGASVDVFRQEPLPDESPFWSREDVFVTPHKASDTTREETIRQLADAAEAMAQGRIPANRVDRDQGY